MPRGRGSADDATMRDVPDDPGGGAGAGLPKERGAEQRSTPGRAAKRQGTSKQHDTWPNEDTPFEPRGGSSASKRRKVAPTEPDAGESETRKQSPLIKLKEADRRNVVRKHIDRMEYKAVRVTPGDQEEDSLFHALNYFVENKHQLKSRLGVDDEAGPKAIKDKLKGLANDVEITFVSGHAPQSQIAAWKLLQAASNCLEVGIAVVCNDGNSLDPQHFEIKPESASSDLIHMCACLGADQGEEDVSVCFFPLAKISDVEPETSGDEEDQDALRGNSADVEALAGGSAISDDKWVVCAGCGFVRVPPADVSRTDFKCSSVAESESSKRIGEVRCKDPSIWLSAFRFFQDTNFKKIGGKELFFPRTRDHKENDFVDLPMLFLAVQAVGDINKVRTLSLLTKIKKYVLHWEYTTDTNDSRPVYSLYTSVFKMTNSSGIDLEAKLLDTPGIVDMIQRRRADVLKILLPDGVRDRRKLDALQNEGMMPDVLHAPKEALTFEQPAHEPSRTEDIYNLIQGFKGVVDESLKGSKGDWTLKLELLQEKLDLQKYTDSISSRKMVFVGDTGSGKSFTLDRLMYASEMDTSRYMKGERKPIRESAGWLWATREVQKANNKMRREAKKYSIKAFPETKDQESALREYLEGSHEKPGPFSINNIEKLMEEDKAAFLLPIGNTSSSTSACPVSIKRADRYQVTLFFETEEELRERWSLESQEEDKKIREKEDKKIRDRIIKEMGLATGMRPNDAIKKWRDTVKGDPSKVSFETCSELAGVLGTVLVFSGSGSDARADRMLMRRLLHHVQGKSDQDLDAELLDSASNLHPLLDFKEDVAQKWGEKISFALKRIYVHAPCQVGPSLDAQLVDSPGSGDSDPIKSARMREELEDADAVIAVCKQHLGNTALVRDGELLEVEEGDGDGDERTFFKCKVMRKLLGTQRVAQDEDSNTFGIPVVVLHNSEQQSQGLLKEGCHADCQCFKCTSLRKDSLKAAGDSMKDLIDKITSIDNLTEAAPDLSNLSESELEERLSERIVFARPFIDRFKTVLREVDLDKWKDSREEMKRCDVFRVLAVIELFQLNTMWPCVDDIMTALGREDTDSGGVKSDGVIGTLEGLLEAFCDKMKVDDEREASQSAKKSSLLPHLEMKKRLGIRKSFYDYEERDDGLLKSIYSKLDEVLETSIQTERLDSGLRQKFFDDVSGKLASNTKKMDSEHLLKNITYTDHQQFETATRKVLWGLRGKVRELGDRLLANIEPGEGEEDRFDLKEAVTRLVSEVLKEDEKQITEEDLKNLRTEVYSDVHRAVKQLVGKWKASLRQQLWDLFEGGWKDTCYVLSLEVGNDAEKCQKLFKKNFLDSQPQDGIKGLVDNFMERIRDEGRQCFFGSPEKGRIEPDSLFQKVKDELVGKDSADSAAPRRGGRPKGKTAGSLNKPFIEQAARLLTGVLHDRRVEDKAHQEFLETMIDSLKVFRSSLINAETKLRDVSGKSCKAVLEEIGMKQGMRFGRQRVLESFNPETQDRVNIDSAAPSRDRTVREHDAHNENYHDLFTLETFAKLEKHPFSSNIVTKRHMEELTTRFGFSKLSDESWRTKKGLGFADHALTIYARKLGHNPVKTTHKKQLRNLINLRALESQDLQQRMGLSDKDVEEYCKKMQTEFPDVRALCLLSELSGRALNVYVPSPDFPRPLRFNPSCDNEGALPRADAIAYLGVKEGRPMWADLISKEQRAGASAGAEDGHVSESQQNHFDEMEEEETAPSGSAHMPVEDTASGNVTGNVTPNYDSEADDGPEATDDAEVFLAWALENATRADEYSEQIFAVGDWVGPTLSGGNRVYKCKHEFLPLTLSVERFEAIHKGTETKSGFAQFSERCVFLQCDPVKKDFRRSRGWKHTVVEDSYAQTDNMLAVFDGVGEAQYWSSRFARDMASSCLQESRMFLNNVGPGEENRSFIILTEAFKKASKRRSRAEREERAKPEGKGLIYTGIFRDDESKRKRLWPKQGTSTAVVLSLVRDRLHACECGDSQWALLRRSDRSPHTFECIYLAQRHHVRGAPNPRTPEQLCDIEKASEAETEAFVRKHSHRPEPLEVKEGDVVIVASDGLWDNLTNYDPRKDPPQKELEDAIVRIANEALAQSQQPGQKMPFIQLLGKKISEKETVAKRHQLGKPDDVAVLVASVTYKLLEGDAEGERDHHCFQGTRACNARVHDGDGCRFYIRSKPTPVS